MYGKSALQQVEWSKVTSVLLTTSYVASDDIKVDFAKRFSLFAYYTSGAASSGNKLDFTLETNPYNAEQDPTGLYWSQAGDWVNTAGTLTEEPFNFQVAQATAGSMKTAITIDFGDLNAARARVKVKEVVNTGAAGTIKMSFVKNDII